MAVSLNDNLSEFCNVSANLPSVLYFYSLSETLRLGLKFGAYVWRMFHLSLHIIALRYCFAHLIYYVQIRSIYN